MRLKLGLGAFVSCRTPLIILIRFYYHCLKPLSLLLFPPPQISNYHVTVLKILTHAFGSSFSFRKRSWSIFQKRIQMEKSFFVRSERLEIETLIRSGMPLLLRGFQTMTFENELRRPPEITTFSKKALLRNRFQKNRNVFNSSHTSFQWKMKQWSKSIMTLFVTQSSYLWAIFYHRRSRNIIIPSADFLSPRAKSGLLILLAP